MKYIKLFEEEEFTKSVGLRSRGYMMNSDQGDKVRKLLSTVLDRVHGTDVYNEIEEDLLEIHIDDDSLFSGFNYPFGGDEWYLDTYETRYNEETEEYDEYNETYPISEIGAEVLSVILDIIMKDPRIIQMINNGYFKKMNENIKSFRIFTK